MTRRARSRIGAVLRDKWRIDELLGIGGMAAVYRGSHRNGKRGAIKILHLELSLDPEAKSRFLQEGYAANRVDHPGAVSVLDDDVAEDGSVFLVMELLDGRSVYDISVERPGARLPPAEALNILDQLLDVLAAAHDKGIVHRDLKPENLFITRGGVVKVLDFGLARVREQRKGHATEAGNPMGTPAFMPPEQALGNWDQVDARSDLWAAGATLFTLLTGRQVHEAPNLNQLMLAAMTLPAPSIGEVLPDLPAPIVALVDRALAFRREDRWQDARQMQRAVREIGRSLPGFTDPPGVSAVPAPRPVDAPASSVESQSLLGTTLLRDAGVPAPRKTRLRAIVGGAAILTALAVVFIAVRPASSPSISAAGPQPSIQPAATPTAAPTLDAPPDPAAPTSSAAVSAAPQSAARTDTTATASAAPRAAGKASPTGSSRAQRAATAPPTTTATDHKDPFLTWE